MVFIGYMEYGNRELFNNDRLAVYRPSMVPLLTVRDCETCDTLADTYTSVSVDPAPWYAASRPVSGEFVGVMPVKVQGLEGDVRETTVTQRHGHGGYVAPVRRPVREVRFTALVIGSTPAGREYGIDWLRGTLNAGDRGPVYGADPAFTAPDFVDQSATCNSDRADLLFYEACPTDNAPAEQMERVLRGAACFDGVTVLAEYSTRSAQMYLVEFGLIAGDPFVYGRESDPITPDLASGAMPTYTCTAPAPLASISDPACPPIPAPPRPPVIPACYSDDTRNQRVGWFIDGADLDPAKPTYPIFNLDADAAVSNLWLRVWPLAPSESDAGGLNACGTVGNMIVGHTAAGRVLRVDPSVQRAVTTLTTGGQTVTADTTHLLLPPESVAAVDGDPFQPLAMEWPVMYGGGPGYIVYAEGASGSALQITLTLVERR